MERSDLDDFKGLHGGSVANMLPVSMRCPKCRRDGTFTDSKNVNDLALPIPWSETSGKKGQLSIKFGHRLCPNPRCKLHVFVIHDDGRLIDSYPPELIDFDASDIPERVTSAFEEALSCHAHGCYMAAAMLIRKTFEELCADREAIGDSLKDRLESLRSKVALPSHFFKGMHNLRMLGNDAVHVESQSYNQIKCEEIEVAIDVAKEILKSCYQTAGIMNRLDNLKGIMAE